MFPPLHRTLPVLLALLLLPLGACSDDAAGDGPPASAEPPTAVPSSERSSDDEDPFPPEPGILAEWDDSRLDSDFFATPWPSDERVTEDGTIALDGFPRSSNAIIGRYRTLFEAEVRGFSTMPVLYVRVPGIGERLEPPTPAESLRPDGPVQLVELSPEACGTLTPIEVRASTVADSYRPADLLMASPVHGFPLRAETRYAFVVRRTLLPHEDPEQRLARPLAFRQRLAEADPAGDAPWDHLVRCLEAADLDLDSVAVATVFTTGAPRALLQTARDFAMNPDNLEPPALVSLEEEPELSAADRTFLRGVVRMPIFMRGDTPYANAGGAFVLDNNGLPVVQRLEDVEIGLLLPADVPNPPLLVWSDGTGATLRSPFRSSVVREAVARGFAVLSWVPQFHDGRSPSADPEISTFNFLNPEAGRTIFLQQAVEASLMLRLAEEVLHGHDDIGELDTRRPLFAGHSQGALVGALVAGVEDRYVAYGLHGVGGYLANTIVERKEPLDFSSLINTLLGVRGTIDRFHPVVQLAQLGSDPVDPGNYAAAWRGDNARPAGNHVYVINGLLDDAVPFRSADHLILAGDVPLLSPAGWDPDPFGVHDTDTVAGTAAGNTAGPDGQPLTIATWMDADHGHFTIYRDADVRRSFLDFLESARDGLPTISPP